MTVDLNEIKKVIPNFLGEIKQFPPAYSAIKVGGTALYKLAREGKDVEVPERTVTIYSIDIIDFKDNELTIDVRCSKGTYIRSLCRDIARAIGTVGTMSSLVRTETGGWHIDNSVHLDEEDLENHIIPIEDALSYMPKFYPGDFFSRLLRNGCEIDTVKLKNLPHSHSLVFNNELLGIGTVIQKNGKNLYKIITHI